MGSSAGGGCGRPATISGDRLPVVPVDAVQGSTVIYDINGVENEFETEDGRFYIDTATGNAYDDFDGETLSNPLGSVNDQPLSVPATLEITSELDGTFRPDNQITRAEVMTVVNKILGRKPHDEYVKSLDVNPFNDLEIKKWYYTIVLEATITHNYYLNDKETLEIKWEDIK